MHPLSLLSSQTPQKFFQTKKFFQLLFSTSILFFPKASTSDSAASSELKLHLEPQLSELMIRFRHYASSSSPSHLPPRNPKPKTSSPSSTKTKSKSTSDRLSPSPSDRHQIASPLPPQIAIRSSLPFPLRHQIASPLPPLLLPLPHAPSSPLPPSPLLSPPLGCAGLGEEESRAADIEGGATRGWAARSGHGRRRLGLGVRGSCGMASRELGSGSLGLRLDSNCWREVRQTEARQDNDGGTGARGGRRRAAPAIVGVKQDLLKAAGGTWFADLGRKKKG